MRLPRLLTCIALVLLVAVPSNVSLAESAPSAAPASSLRLNKGAWWGEVSGAVLGTILSTAISAAVFTPLYLNHYCEDPEGDGCGDHNAAIMGGAFSFGLVSRLALVGGLTAACARPSGGQGTAWAAVLGAAPGAAMIFGSWYLPDHGYAALGLSLGHVATVVGAVVAYRASAKRRHRRASHLTQLIPEPYVGRGGVTGLAWSRAF